MLAEKGQDWKKMDEQFEAVKIKEHVEKKEGFGFGNGRASLPDEATDGSWRKPVSDDDARPTRFVLKENRKKISCFLCVMCS